MRDQSSPKYYRISNGKRGYLLYPGTNDGRADAYGVADMWFLHWHDGPTPLEAEIDDGHGYFDSTQADLDQFLTGERHENQHAERPRRGRARPGSRRILDGLGRVARTSRMFQQFEAVARPRGTGSSADSILGR